jgi:hypothetical protein
MGGSGKYRGVLLRRCLLLGRNISECVDIFRGLPQRERTSEQSLVKSCCGLVIILGRAAAAVYILCCSETEDQRDARGLHFFNAGHMWRLQRLARAHA